MRVCVCIYMHVCEGQISTLTLIPRELVTLFYNVYFPYMYYFWVGNAGVPRTTMCMWWSEYSFINRFLNFLCVLGTTLQSSDLSSEHLYSHLPCLHKACCCFTNV